MEKLTNETFISKAVLIHGNKFNYAKVNYINTNSKIIITCPIHGDFEQTPKLHIKGRGCHECGGSKCLTTNKFIDKVKQVHGDKYNYSSVEYKTTHSKVTIICPTHGKFEQAPSMHLQGQGCSECVGLKKSKTDKFINQAKEIHNKYYDYSLVNYVNNKNKIKIICPIHGEFEQEPRHHLSGHGCPSCSVESNGWNYHLWEEQALKSNRFESFKLYMIKCWDETETFYKIGKTFNKLNTRFSGTNRLPYNWELVKFIEGTAQEISELETELKRKHKEHSYTPKKMFGGMYECYSELIY